jgi:hypothetical protein
VTDKETRGKQQRLHKQPRGQPGEPEKRPSPREIALQAQRLLADITDMEAEAVTSIQQDDEGTWQVTVDVLELARIPDSEDMLGSYQVELDERGELRGYRRLGRYSRSQVDTGQISGA